MTDIQQLIKAGYERSKGASVDSISVKLFPARLRPQFNQIATKYYVTGSLNEDEIHFLTVYTTKPLEELNELAWFNGEFYKYKSYKHKNYNLRRAVGQKQVKRIRTANDYWLK
jgi:hypothetical protein